MAVKLAGLDMNLLVVFDALVAERSVTRAAKRLALSQPATSNALARLRKTLGDPLLVSTAEGMTPTVRGRELAKIVQSALRRIEDALVTGATFEPATSVRSFTVAVSDYGELVVVTELMKLLARVAPGVDLRVTRLGLELPLSDMEDGRIDLTVGLSRGGVRGLYQQRLFHDRLTCVVRERHPILRGRMTLERFVRLSHVQIETRSAPLGMLDAALARRGKRRTIALHVPHALVAALIVADSDLVATVPERLVRAMTKIAHLRRFDPPVSIAPFAVTQLWHARVHDEPAHRWLRAQVAQASA
jgi:DNA-binding transcriptional LysR family regulator